MSSQLTHEERVRAAAALRDQGNSVAFIASRFGVARSTVRQWLTDPTGAKVRARKMRYRGTCEKCGAKTDGSNGRAKAPKFCLRCRYEPPRHGTISCYTTGCRCGDCQTAQREYQIGLKGKEPPNHGTVSGYGNYACRCELCRAAGARNVRRLWRSGRTKAHAAVRAAVKSGRLIKPESCEVCGATDKRIEGHHEDHDRPLDVQWLCSRCHGATRWRRAVA